MSSYSVKNYFHATLQSTLPKIIAAGGIDPAFATGKRKLSWYVDFEHITNAIAHCRFKRGYPTGGIIVCKVKCQERYMHRMYSGKFFCTRVKLTVIETIDAPTFILREEARMFTLEREIAGDDWYEHLREKS